MKQRIARLLIAVMFIAIIQPLFLPHKAEAAVDLSINASEDKSYDLTGYYPNGLPDGGGDSFQHQAGYAREATDEYGDSTLAIRFPLTGINAAKTIQNAILSLGVKSVEGDPDVPDTVETYKLFLSSDTAWTEGNTAPVNEATLTPAGVYGKDVFTTNTIVQIDIASYLNAYRSANPSATSVTVVVKGPLKSDLGAESAAGKTTYVYAFIYDRNYSDSAWRPRIDITYVPNSAPTDIALSNASVAENAAVNTTVGTLSATDPDAGDTFTYSLVSGTGDTDNASFNISGSQLRTSASFNYESKNSYSVRVRVSDSYNAAYEKAFTIAVTNVNEAPTGTVSINGGASGTASANVTLTLTGTDPDAGDTLTMSFSNDNATWSTPVAFATSRAHTLAAGDGTKTVYFRLADAGALSNTSTDTITLDTAGPAATLSINSGAALTNSANVTLGATSSDASLPVESRYSNDGTTWSSWSAFNPPQAWALAPGDGSKTVTMELRDALGNVSSVSDTITLDTTPPAGTISIAGGAAAVNATSVQLGLTNPDGTAVEMQFQNDGGAWSGWIPFAMTHSWALNGVDGTKTVSVQFRDAAGNVSTASDTIELDTIAPIVTGVTNGGVYNTDVTIDFDEGTATLDTVSFNKNETVSDEGVHQLVVTDDAGNVTTISFTIDTTAPNGTLAINGGDAATKQAAVSLTIDNPDGTAVQMQLSNDGTSWSGWEAYASSKSWTLSGADGAKTVHVQLKDAAGNIASITDSITLDTTPPNGSITINGGDSYTNDTGVELAIANPDGSAATMRIQNAGGAWSGLQPFDTTAAWTLPSGDGSKTVNVELADALGNVQTVTATITLDQTAPTVGGVAGGGLYNSDRTITFSDPDAELNGTAISTNHVVTDEGTYTLVVRDLAGNLTTLSFEIDKTPPSGTLAINGGDAATKQTAVNLTIGNPDGTAVQMQISNDGTTWSALEAFAVAKSWTIGGADGAKTVRLRLIDAAGNMASVADSITLDTTPPNGSVAINGGDAYTNDTDVELTIANPDSSAATMRIQNAGGAWSALQPFAATADWTLDAGEGLKTVNVELADALGNVSTIAAAITLDQTAPTVGGVADGGLYNTDRTITFADPDAELNGTSISTNLVVTDEGAYTLVVRDLAGNQTSLSFKIDKTAPDGSVTVNGGAANTAAADVELTIANPDGTAVEMQFQNAGGAWSGWEAYAATRSWTLDAGDGVKDVSVQLRDAAGNIYSASDAITLDTTLPDGSIAINGGAAYTTSTAVSLSVSNPDGTAVEMRFQNDGGTWSAWEALAPTKAWTLSAGEGSKTVKLQLKDATGNVYETNDSIAFDATAPTGTVSVNGGDAFAASLNAQLTLASDGTAAEMRLSNDGTAWSAWEAYDTNAPIVLQAGDGSRTAYVELRDAAGNVRQMTDSIVVDMTAPTGTAIVNGGAALTTDASVTVGLTAADGPAPASGVVEASVSADGGTTWSSWTAIAPELTATLPGGYGNKTVQVKVRDAAGNESAPFSDSIVLRSVPSLSDSAASSPEDAEYAFGTADFGYASADGFAIYSIKVLTLPVHGVLKLDGTAMVAGQQIAAADIAKLTFTPAPDWNGHTSLQWTGGADGVAAAGNAVIDLSITAVNDAPVTEVVGVTVTGIVEAKGTAKARDVDGDSLTYSVVAPPSSGQLTMDAATGAFTFKPNGYGMQTFTYRAFDGTAYSNVSTVTITVNAPPIIVPPTPKPDPDPKPPITIPGIDDPGLKGRAETEVGSTDLGHTVTVKLEGEDWKGHLPNQPGDAVAIIVNDDAGADAGVVQLDSSMADTLAKDGRDLLLEVDGRTIAVSAEMLAAFAAHMTDPADILRIELAPARESDADKTEAAVNKVKAKLAAIPMHYQVYIDRNGKRIDLSAINGYVTIGYRPDELKGNPTTAALLVPSGKLKPLPTQFVKTESGTVIRVHGLTQGTFALIELKNAFRDTNGHWASQAIGTLADRFVVNGVGSGLFQPSRTATRAEFASILVQAFGLYGSAAQLAYSDTQAEAWYGEALSFASGNGLITGYADGTFRPNATITREEAMVILARAAALVGLQGELSKEQVDQALGSFGDASSLHSWSRDAAALCVSLGIVNGIGSDLDPEQPITRAQLAVMVEKLLKKAGYI